MSRLLILLLSASLCWAETTEPAEKPTPTPEAGEVSFVGSWTARDDGQQPFDLVLFANGQAVTNWTKGPARARGERGFWREIGGRAVVFFNDGWTDVIEAGPEGFVHRGFSPGTSLDGEPTNQSPATRVPTPEADVVGVWRLNREPDGSFLYVVVQAGGRAASSINGLTEGRWEILGKGIRCTWPDGWTDVIEPDPSGGWKKSAWVGEKPEDPEAIDVTPAVRVGETPFGVNP